MFITLEDETDVANLVVWTNVVDKNRRTVLGASMMGVRGQVQREGDVIHVIAQRLDDLSPLLASVGNRADVANIYRQSRADRPEEHTSELQSLMSNSYAVFFLQKKKATRRKSTMVGRIQDQHVKCTE